MRSSLRGHVTNYCVIITAIKELNAEPSFAEGEIFMLLWWKLSSLNFKVIGS